MAEHEVARLPEYRGLRGTRRAEPHERARGAVREECKETGHG